MKIYSITVIEVRHQECVYHVEASNETEATEAAERGDTTEEAERGSYDVHMRSVIPDSISEI